MSYILMRRVRKAVFFSILILFSFNSYAFWIWSSKTKKWKNPKHSPLVTPYLQYREALNYFEKKNYNAAQREFRKLLVNYPDSREAAETQYYLGRCLEETDKPYEAFLEYQKVIDSYPNSKRINEVAEREYKIGEYLLNRKPKQWLGMNVYDFIEHPSIEIFKKIAEKVPFSPYASSAEYKLGVLLLRLERYDEAQDAFQKVIDNYPDSKWALPAKYQLAIAIAKFSYGSDYDSTSVKEATERLKEFIQKHPDAEIASSAQAQLEMLKDKEAKKNFDIAQFYEKQEKYNAAQLYYQLVLEKYPHSEYAQQAQERIEELKKSDE